MKKVRINRGRYFRSATRGVVTVILLASVILSLIFLDQMLSIIVAMILSMLLPCVWSTYYLLEIDIEKGVILEKRWSMGWSVTLEKTISKIERIEVMSYTPDQIDADWKGILKYSKLKKKVALMRLEDDSLYYLLSSDTEDEIREKLLPFEQKLNLEIVRTVAQKKS